MDYPEYSDPIVIPITLAIPDPRWRPKGGRWDHGPFHPPLHTGNSPARPEDRAPVVTRPWSPAFERGVAIMAQYAGPAAASAAAPAAASGQAAQGEKQLMSHAARAMRRIREIAEEAARGELGAAAGHLFLGLPYSEEVDSGFAPMVVHNEHTDPPVGQPDQSDTELEQATVKLKRYLEDRREGALDERHLQDAEADRRGEPILRPDGKAVDHELEVSEAAWGLRKEINDLEKKLRHDTRQETSGSNKDAIAEAQSIIKESNDLLNEIYRRLPGLRRRVQARKRSSNAKE